MNILHMHLKDRRLKGDALPSQREWNGSLCEKK